MDKAKYLKHRAKVNWLYFCNKHLSSVYDFNYNQHNPNTYYRMRLLNNDFKFDKLRDKDYLLNYQALFFVIKADSKVKIGDRISMVIVGKDLDPSTAKDGYLDYEEYKDYKLTSKNSKISKFDLILGGDNSDTCLEVKDSNRLKSMPFRFFNLKKIEAYVYFLVYDISKDPFNPNDFILTTSYIETKNANKIKFTDEVYVS